jgi:hypothetical protein
VTDEIDRPDRLTPDVGAFIVHRASPEAKDGAILFHSDFRVVVHLIPMCAGAHVLGAVFDPLDRTSRLLGEKTYEHEVRVGVVLDSETTADIRRDAPYPFRPHA